MQREGYYTSQALMSDLTTTLVKVSERYLYRAAPITLDKVDIALFELKLKLKEYHAQKLSV